ncbi:MAG: class I SAM-dependent methyltransferase, partial [Solirubrobacterales bacterium]
MLDSSIARIFELVDDDDIVLDVGGWIKPFTRADYVIDLLPYSTRGDLGAIGTGPERFDESRWIQRDICDREPFPFADDQFDFAICSHTLEDVRDPIWVCEEISRVARAGYVEAPSRAEEQSYGFDGRFTGWGHHRWLVDVADGGLEFTMKSERVEL